MSLLEKSKTEKKKQKNKKRREKSDREESADGSVYQQVRSRCIITTLLLCTITIIMLFLLFHPTLYKYSVHSNLEVVLWISPIDKFLPATFDSLVSTVAWPASVSVFLFVYSLFIYLYYDTS